MTVIAAPTRALSPSEVALAYHRRTKHSLERYAAGLRGTGIGCYFDDALHDALGINTMEFQALYNFTVGRPLTDTRITTLPPYPDRQPHGREA